MSVAQRLYEGVETRRGPGRPDHLHANRLGGALEPGHGRGGARHRGALRRRSTPLPKGRAFKTKTRDAQEAHEAIRPTSFHRDPDAVARRLGSDEARLYRLIWQRAIASQMAAKEQETTTVDLAADGYDLRANATRTTFDGFSRVYTEGQDDAEEEAECRLPDARRGRRRPTSSRSRRSSTSPSRRRATPRPR